MSNFFKKSPLPFQGQKRSWFYKFSNVIKQYDESYIFVDLFGGSGLLSDITKRIHPKSRVIYNDFDNFYNRLLNVDNTNDILNKIRDLVKGIPKKHRINDEIKSDIIEILQNESKKGFVDWITISSNILFSMNYSINLEDLTKECFYNRIPFSIYSCKDYLEGVEIVSMDYKELYSQFKDIKNVVFIVDPPYLTTDIKTYSNNYWKLSDYLDIIKILDGVNYIYFTSDKSNLLDLIEWFLENNILKNTFDGIEKEYLNSIVSSKSKYTDIMIHKRNKHH